MSATSSTEGRSLPSWECPDRRAAASNALVTRVLDPAHGTLHQVAATLAKEWGLSAHEVAVWLAELLTDGAKVLRERVAGEAEAAGLPIGTIAAAMGQSTTSNGRRRTPHSRDFALARRAADLTGVGVDVNVSTWRIRVEPAG